MSDIEKVVIITQNTWLDGLIEKYNTKEQAKFYINHNGGSFQEYLDQHQAYYSSLLQLKKQIPSKLRYQVVEKSFLPSFMFGPNDLVIVLGRDGLVVNTAKYLKDQPILGVNPDPARIDGILLKFQVNQVSEMIQKIQEKEAIIGEITLVKAELNNGQTLIGVNDIFIGHQSHQSARYTIKINGEVERQSSSGIVISTGIGSTGWMKSIVSSSINISNHTVFAKLDCKQDFSFPWDANHLFYVVREAWPSSKTGNSVIFGRIDYLNTLEIISHMPSGGVIFSDGMEKDKVEFNSGRSVIITVAPSKVKYYKNPS